MNKLKILYVWGYGDSPDSEYVTNLKKGLDPKKFTIISDYYAQYNPKEAVYDLTEIIKKEKIDLVIGENLGGYLITLLDNELPKIIINPIYDPVIELSEYRGIAKDDNNNDIEVKLVPDHIINFYKDNEDMKRYMDNVYAIFSVNDNYNEYSKICNRIVKVDDPIEKIIDTIKEC